MTRVAPRPAAIVVRQPATEEVLREVRAVEPHELPGAVDRAGAAAAEWNRTPLAERAARMLAVASGIDRELHALAELECLNVGKPIRQARAEVQLAADTFRFYAGAVDKHGGSTFPAADGLHYTVRRPCGVVGAIVPWNFPLVLASWKVAPAIAAGNAILVKPAALTPLSAMRLEEICRGAGLPGGLVQALPGAGGTLGRAIVDHPQIRKISFTGSTDVGREIAVGAAAGFKPVTLELGGKAANVIFADADLERALDGAIDGCFANAGQDCCSRARILVERSISGQALEYLQARIENIRVGLPLEESTEMGPLVSAAHRKTVSGYIADATSVGATLVCGGEQPPGRGYYLTPALLADVTPDMRVMQEEIFGPVAMVHPFRDEADAIAIANGTAFGLATSVWTGDADRSIRVAHAIDAGAVSVNSNNAVRITAPFGGVKASGLGRELGMAAMDAYSEIKTVFHSVPTFNEGAHR